jgi:hypothetical protein
MVRTEQSLFVIKFNIRTKKPIKIHKLLQFFALLKTKLLIYFFQETKLHYLTQTKKIQVPSSEKQIIKFSGKSRGAKKVKRTNQSGGGRGQLLVSACNLGAHPKKRLRTWGMQSAAADDPFPFTHRPASLD